MARPRSDIEPRIVAAARRRFLEDGVDGASLRKIASDAKTSIGMVYYYFPNKDDLFLGVVEETYAKLVEDLTLALRPDVPVRERIRRLYARVGSVSEDELAIVRLMAREILVSSSRLVRVMGRFQRGHLPLVVAALADGVKDGSIRDDLPPAVLLLCTVAVGALPQMALRILGKPFPFVVPAQGEELAQQLASVLFEGIGGSAGRTRSVSSAASSAAQRRPA